MMMYRDGVLVGWYWFDVRSDVNENIIRFVDIVRE